MLTFKIKDLFFDRPKVKAAVDAAKRKVLSKAGAFIRTRAQTSIRRRKGSSPPGKAPHSHVGLLRKLILFGYDRGSDSVVAGPVGLRDSEAPHVLEFGGTTTVEEGPRRKRRKRRVKIAARSYMGPALEAEKDKLPALWRGSVRGG